MLLHQSAHRIFERRPRKYNNAIRTEWWNWVHSTYQSPKHYAKWNSLSTGFHNVPMHKVHFLVGVNLTGGIPLVELVEHFGLLGKTAGPLLLVMEGWTSLVELTGTLTCPHSIALLVKDCGTGLLIGKAGSSSFGSFEAKGLWECDGTIPTAFHSLPSASNSNNKVEILAWSWTSFFSVWNCLKTWSNMIQGPWLVDQLHQFSIHFQWLLSQIQADLVQVPFWMMVRSTGLSSQQFLAWIMEVSIDFPTLEGICGREVLGLHPV